MHTNLVTCPRCGATNPSKAAVCWACLCALAENAQQRVVNNAPHHRKGERRQRVEWHAALVLILGGTSTLVASGYSRRNRRELLGIGTFAATLLGVLLKCDDIQSKRLKARMELLVESPAARHANQILLYSIRLDAREIRFHTGYGGATVEYLVGEGWQNGAALPVELWGEMRTEWAHKSGDWQHMIRVTVQGQPFLFAARFERDSLDESLILTRQDAGVSPPLALEGAPQGKQRDEQ